MRDLFNIAIVALFIYVSYGWFFDDEYQETGPGATGISQEDQRVILDALYNQ
jgi:hypothetical protein